MIMESEGFEDECGVEVVDGEEMVGDLRIPVDVRLSNWHPKKMSTKATNLRVPKAMVPPPTERRKVGRLLVRRNT